MRQRLEKAIRWWIDTLTEAAEDLAAGGVGRQPYELRPEINGYAIHRQDRPGDEPPLGRLILINGKAASFEPAGLERSLAGRTVVVRIPGDWLFEQTLEPFPRESESVIPGIVRHQIERVTPFRASDTFYDYSVDTLDDESRRLLITVSVVPKGLVAGVVSALSATGPRRLVLAAGLPDGRERHLSVSLGNSVTPKSSGMRRLVTGVVGGLALLLVSAGIGANWWLSSLASETEELQAAIAERHARLGSANSAAGAQALDEPTRLRQLKASQPPVVALIDILSQRLPDDAYLTELQFDHQRVRLIGVSRDVSKLIPAIEGSPRFGGAAFASPTTRLAHDQGDRFHIEVTVRPDRGASDRATPDRGAKP